MDCLRRHNHALGEATLLNVSPLRRSEGVDEIGLILGGGHDTRLDTVEFRLYPEPCD